MKTLHQHEPHNTTHQKETSAHYEHIGRMHVRSLEAANPAP